MLLIVSVTLGLGFYAPLLETHELLKRELSATQSTAARLQASLTEEEAAVRERTREVSELSKFAEEIRAKDQHYPEAAERLSRGAAPALTTALEKKDVRVLALGDGVAVQLVRAGLFNRQRSALSWAGAQLSCPAVKAALAAGLSQLTVRSFAPGEVATKDLQSTFEAASALAASVAQHLVRTCSVPITDIGVATSTATGEAPVLQLEFRERLTSP